MERLTGRAVWLFFLYKKNVINLLTKLSTSDIILIYRGNKSINQASAGEEYPHINKNPARIGKGSEDYEKTNYRRADGTVSSNVRKD